MLFARPDATDEQIVLALKRANAWDFVSNMADGVLTNVGAAGG